MARFPEKYRVRICGIPVMTLHIEVIPGRVRGRSVEINVRAKITEHRCRLYFCKFLAALCRLWPARLLTIDMDEVSYEGNS